MCNAVSASMRRSVSIDLSKIQFKDMKYRDHNVTLSFEKQHSNIPRDLFNARLTDVEVVEIIPC